MRCQLEGAVEPLGEISFFFTPHGHPLLRFPFVGGIAPLSYAEYGAPPSVKPYQCCVVVCLFLRTAGARMRTHCFVLRSVAVSHRYRTRSAVRHPL